MDLDEKMSDGIIEESERPPEQTSTIVFELKDKVIQYSEEDGVITQQVIKNYASSYFG
ncbi:hypothetical protein KY338_07095 [Candidatus Woesearchaeota archaeon]|nr:hypothetical protein [Candidatus Woesearchaeota archaeon]MBW3005833.1 hypothetical protein [Candidatus Woesearchaeota archaeon]